MLTSDDRGLSQEVPVAGRLPRLVDGVDACRTLLSPPDFRKRLARERDGADLDGRPCLLLVFSICNGRSSRGHAQLLPSIVGHQFCAKDAMAWINKHHLGVITRQIDVPRARQIGVDASRESKAATGRRLNCDVYSYPGSWLYEQHYGLDGDLEANTSTSPAEIRAGADRGDIGVEQLTISACHIEKSSGVSQLSIGCVGRQLFRPLPFWKRAIDIFGSCVALALFAPLMLAVAAWIRLSSSGPVIFRQVRWGFLGRPFTMFKFRTMREDVDPERHRRYVTELLHARGALNKMEAQSELIPLGGFLRRSGIDELPQLFNVLRGEMSLVGPRPDVIPLDVYSPRDAQRLEVLPGITGLWQVSGKNRTTFEEMLELDATYARNRSFWLDLKILFRTLPTLVRELREKNSSSSDPA